MNADVTVREVMNQEYVGVSEPDELIETVELLLREEAEVAIVLRGSEPIGVVTERDILALLVEGPDPETATVEEAMTASVPTVAPETSLERATDEMSARSASVLIVTDGDEPLGIITKEDLLTSRTVHPGGAEQTVETTAPAAGAVAATEATTESGEPVDAFEEQGICEVCGSLTRDLSSFNGQLLCAECRDM